MGLFSKSNAPVWPKVVLRQGQVIKDDDGRVVCTVTRDCYNGEFFSLSMFSFVDGETPVPGQFVHPAICKAAGVRASA